MLRNIFPDEPVSDQDNSRNAEDPGGVLSQQQQIVLPRESICNARDVKSGGWLVD